MVYPKVLIFYSNFPLENAITRVRAMKVTLYAHESLTFPKWARKYSKSIEIQNKQKNKVQSWKYIKKTEMKMLIERDILLLITLRRRRKP